MDRATQAFDEAQEVRIPAGRVELAGSLILPPEARAVVLFAHGSGSSRHSPRNRFVASTLSDGGLGTLLFDLLTEEEEEVDARTAHLRFDIDLLAERLVHGTDWMAASRPELRVGYFGSSTGAAASLIAAAERADRAGAVVSRGGRPDLAGPALQQVRAATLLLVGGEDRPVIELNREALAQLRATKRLEIIPGATHLFVEPGTLEQVARLAEAWFREHLLDREF